MKYAIIENGLVVNVATADAPLAENWIEAGSAKKGDTWDGSTFTTPAKVVTAEMVKAERDRRLEADFEFQGKMYQRDSKSLDRITGAATLAGFAIAAGAQVGDLRWANATRDFGWIASDDTVTTMDAQTAFAFGQAAAERETSIVFAAKTLREMDPIPTDYTDDGYWP